MKICSDTHDEVCFDGQICPACSLIDIIDDLNNEVRRLKEKIEN